MEEVHVNILHNINSLTKENDKKEVYIRLISFIDATMLDIAQNGSTIERFTRKVVEMVSDDAFPQVASICVSPAFIENVGLALGEESPIAVCSVGACFPLAHTYLEVKMLECAMAMENGAEEIDVVINVGDILHGDGELALSELCVLREELGDDITLKVIIESGALQTEELVRRATGIAIEAGADFVKTSTGKHSVGATHEAVCVICDEVKKHYEKTGHMVGVKVSGGVSTTQTALEYYTIVHNMLGEKWMNPNYFRIGSSSLLNNVIKEYKTL